MNKILLPFFFFSLMSFSSHKIPTGKYRWDIKLCIDAAGQQVLAFPSETSSIEQLVNMHRPTSDQLGEHRAPSEKKKVKVTALIIEAGKEDDGDFHLVLMNESHTVSLIAEIPDPTDPLLYNFPLQKKMFADGRTFFLQHIDPSPGSVMSLQHQVKVEIEGIVFFDKLSHGNGHAMNGIEIHPVTNLTLSN